MKSFSIFRRKGVRVPQVDSSYPKKIQDRAAELNKRVAALEGHQREVAKRRNEFSDRLDSVDVSDTPENFETAEGAVVSGEENYEAGSLRDQDFNLLREERLFRKDLAEFIEDWKIATRKISYDAKQKELEVREEVLQGLIRFGFLDPAIHKLSHSRVFPGYVFQHPRVVAAVNENKRLQALLGDSIGADNLEALQEVEEQIILEKRRLLNLEQSVA